MPLGPLSGFTIGVTADRRADEQIRLLRRAGADCLHGATVRTRSIDAEDERPGDLRPAERLVRGVVERRLDGVTFISRPAAENLVLIAGELGLRDALLAAFARAVKAFCAGPAGADGCRRVGIQAPLHPARHRLEGLVDVVSDHFAVQRGDFELGGHPVRVQGRLVLVSGGEPVRLSDRERQLFAALAHAPGVVHSKQTLLRDVWAGSDSDEHTVEVTVARLRQRLGPAGAGIETVVRRGYRLTSV